MAIEQKYINLRWSDLDPNFHVKHSSYYDLASQYRMDILDYYNITMEVMEEHGFAPILLREECIFKREIKFKDKVTINFLIESTANSSTKWYILHEFKDSQGKLKANLRVEIVWFDIKARKIMRELPEVLQAGLRRMTEDAELS